MALVPTLSGDWLGSIGSLRIVTGTLAFDASYPTGGEPLTPATLGLGVIHFLIAEPNSGYVFTYDYANQKLLAYYADYDAVADGPLIQFPDATSLAALTAVKFMAIGR